MEEYLEQAEDSLPRAKPALWASASRWIQRVGRSLGRRTHRWVISALLALWLAVIAGYIWTLLQGGAGLDNQVLRWREPLLIIQVVTAGSMIIALVTWIMGNEKRGLNFAVAGMLVSLVALQTLYFYLSQFSAITTTILQLGILLILVAYRRWYLTDVATSQ